MCLPDRELFSDSKLNHLDLTMADLPSFNPHPDSDLRYAYLKAVKDFAHLDEVTGIDIGYKYEGDKPTTIIAIRVHVKKKVKPPEAVPPGHLIATEIGNIPTDVIQATYRALRLVGLPDTHLLSAPILPPGTPARWKAVDPLQPGVLVENPSSGTKGTLGAIVYDVLNSHRECLLSNWHVFMPGTGADPDAISQP